ncbi:MAG: AmmeMemoRadiSam system protein B [Bacteroidales bacterium]|nr:AmmeMemoRadiSam system protein B [Bacteroidales bacterium]
MQQSAILCLLFIMGIFSFSGSRAQNNESHRKPVAAGRFYPHAPDVLEKEIRGLFKSSDSFAEGILRGMIIPHAGYVFSGKTAAAAISQIKKPYVYQRIFILAPSHYVTHSGASLYAPGNYITPLGMVSTDHETVKKLLQNPFFNYLPEAHTREHAIEVQLPLLQYYFGKEMPPIVPIVITTQNADECCKLAMQLKPWFTKENLFIVSSDFSHYPSYEEARLADRKTAESILSNSAQHFLATKTQVEREGIPGLSTAACGWNSILTLLCLSEKEETTHYEILSYTNSGDHPQYGDRNQVVGYNAIILKDGIKSSENDFSVTAEEGQEIVAFARKTIQEVVTDGKLQEMDIQSLPDIFHWNCGAFVTLRKEGALRGCIGRFGEKEPLWLVIQEMAVAAALHDSRFDPVTTEELDALHIEVSLLTPMTPVTDTATIIPGVHGIYIRKGGRSGTYLPQVAIETGWDTEALLGHCSRDKAGIGWNGWKEAELFTYQAIRFNESLSGEH